MKKRRNASHVDEFIEKVQTNLLNEFGRVDLPLAVQVLARNRASKEGITSKQALDALIAEPGGLEKVLQETKKMVRSIRRKAARASSSGSPKGVFGSTTLLPGAPPLQGGAPGAGRSSRRR
jgi:hypothetical protein